MTAAAAPAISSDNAGIARAVFFSAGSLVLAKAVHLGLNVVASLAIIRHLGPSGYGDYLFVFSLSAIFGLLSDFGIPKVVTRDMSRDPAASSGILGTAVSVRLMLAASCWLLAQGVLVLMAARQDIRAAVAVGALLFVNEALLSVSVIFQVRLAMQYLAFTTVAGQATQTALILWLVAHDATLLQLVAAPLLTGALEVALVVFIARARFRTRLSLDLKRLPELFQQAWPIGLVLFFGATYLKIDNILLTGLASPHEAGMYGAAYKPVEYLLLGCGVVINPIFPLLARWQGIDSQRFHYVHRRATQAILAIVLPIPVVIALIADPLVRAVYPADFAPSAMPLRVLSITLVFLILTAWQDITLLSAGRQRVTAVYLGSMVVLHIVLSAALIRPFGYMGAAFAALASSFFVCCCAWFAGGRLLGVSLRLALLAGVILASVALGIVLSLLLQLGIPWLVSALLAALVYPAWLLLFRVTNLQELRLLIPVRRLGGAPAL